MTTHILIGDARERLKDLPDESVHCVVTSPPYWGLRDYGVAGQLGLEPYFADYVSTMVEVFRDVRRVLRSEGTVWLNLGDSYANDGKWGGPTGGKHVTALHGNAGAGRGKRSTGLKPKDLVGIPWRVAFGLQADGWWLRQDIIWAKPNPMPESVTDRCTKAHEYLFLLSKSERYRFDAETISEAAESRDYVTWDERKKSGEPSRRGLKAEMRPGNVNGLAPRGGKRNRRSVWTIDENEFEQFLDWKAAQTGKPDVWTVATRPFEGSHFATFPPALIEPCILAGCPAGGTVLDPFGGAGTTGLVADRLGRNSILIELNPAYAEMARTRIRNDAGLFSDIHAGV